MKKRRKSLKNVNGFGGVAFLGENRRNPYGARIFNGYNKNGSMKYKYIGYADDWDEAYNILLEYHKNPYNLDYKNITFKGIFEKIQPDMEKNIDVPGKRMSKSNYTNLISVWENQLKNIHNWKILETKKMMLQVIFNDCPNGHTTKGYMKNVLSRIYEYAIDMLELPIQKNIGKELKIGSKEKSDLHKIFLTNEIKLLWENNDNYFIQLLLISLYIGVRPKELITIEIKNVHLDENYMIGGCKTEAGKDRIIPIHSKIKPMIKKIYNKDNKYLFINPNTNENMTYDFYYKHTKKVIKKLNLDHTPYDTRHTFGTQLKLCGVSESDRKWLMGHSQSDDVTNDVYTHLTPDYLIKQIEKLEY